MKVTEIFPSVQGEGKFAGHPMTFVRLSGCNRSCPWCDTKYHTEGKEMSVFEIRDRVNEFGMDTVCWTGGEPLVQYKELARALTFLPDLQHHIETNGDLLTVESLSRFHWVTVSPKTVEVAKRVYELCGERVDIKVVTDLDTVGKELVQYATCLMPLTTYTDKDLDIQQRVWQYCTDNHIRYSPRLQISVWGQKKGI